MEVKNKEIVLSFKKDKLWRSIQLRAILNMNTTTLIKSYNQLKPVNTKKTVEIWFKR